MMLKYSLCEPELATAVNEAVRAAIDKGMRTPDIGGSLKTKEVGDAIVAELAQILRAKKA